MKTMKLVLVAVALATFFSSCKKSSEDTAIVGNGFLNAKVDGAAFTSTLAVTGTITTGSPKVFAVAGTGSNGQINLNIGNYTGPGTYTIGASGAAGNAAIYALTATPFTAYTANFVLGSGSIVVSAESGGYVEGTFSFSGKNNSGGSITSKEITEGSFKVKLQ